MKKRLIPLLILFTALLSLNACQEFDADIDLPLGEKSLVMSAFLSPEDTLIRVWAFYTVPTIGKSDQENNYVADGLVTISDGITTDTLYFDYESRSYFLMMNEYPIEGGKSYTIRVKDTEGRIASAICTVPETGLLNFDYQVDSVVHANGTVNYIFRMEWDDVPGQIRYYRTDAELMYMTEDTTREIYEFFDEELKPSVRELHKGSGTGGRMSITYTSTAIPPAVFKLFNLMLYNTDENYYLFHLNNNGLNINFLPIYEPTENYTNVKGGLGILGAYNNMNHTYINN
jgi:hypothetical protein